MKFSINIEIPSWVWFLIHFLIVLLSCITLAVMDDRGDIPWDTFTLVEEILTIFTFIVVFFRHSPSVGTAGSSKIFCYGVRIAETTILRKVDIKVI